MTEQIEATLEAHYNTPPESVTLYGNEFKRKTPVGFYGPPVSMEVPDRLDPTKTEFVFQAYQWWDITLEYSYSTADLAPIWFASMNGSQSAHQGDIASTPKEALDKLFQKVTAAYHGNAAAWERAEENRLHLGCDVANLQAFLQQGQQHPKP